jgi:hypothetical protein
MMMVSVVTFLFVIHHHHPWPPSLTHPSQSPITTNRSQQQSTGKWLALQAALSVACLYGGRFLCASLFAAFYVQLPAYELLGAVRLID